MKNSTVGKPDHHVWRWSVSGRGPEQVDPVVQVPFRLRRDDLSTISQQRRPRP